MVKCRGETSDGKQVIIKTDGGRETDAGGEPDDDYLLAYCLVFGLLFGTMLMIFSDTIGGMGPAIGLLVGLWAWIFLSGLR